MDYMSLEEIAQRSHNGKLKTTDSETRYGGIRMFEMSLRVSIRKRIELLKARFPQEHLLVADIGGSHGDLTGEISKIGGVCPFVIDVYPCFPANSILSRNRFIRADAEKMPEIPDGAFHYIVSFNVLTYTDVSLSVPEIYRILRKGGIADLDWEFPDKGQLARLSKDQIARHLTITPMMGTCLIHFEK